MDVLGTLIYIIYLTKLEVCTSISIVDYIFEIKQIKERKTEMKATFYNVTCQKIRFL